MAGPVLSFNSGHQQKCSQSCSSLIIPRITSAQLLPPVETSHLHPPAHFNDRRHVHIVRFLVSRILRVDELEFLGHRWSRAKASSRAGSHRPALSEPCVNLSTHTAPTIQPDRLLRRDCYPEPPVREHAIGALFHAP